MIFLSNLVVDFDQHFQLENIDWEILPEQHWAITGSNGAGKSALAAVLHGDGDIVAGDISGLPDRVAVVSFEAQATLIEEERKKDDADLLDVISEGTPVQQILDQTCCNKTLQQQLIQEFTFTPLLDRSFRKLSSGETRKVMLIRALSADPDLLILDEPFEGLDIASQRFLGELLNDLSQRLQIVMVLNRFNEIPQFITHIGYVRHGALQFRVDRNDHDAVADLSKLLHLNATSLEVPAVEPFHPPSGLDPSAPLVRMRQAEVAYGDNIIFERLDWEIFPGIHWQVIGPNGSGKTCLLNLITGDHPQCYVNDLLIFGMQRGSGETIWDIKRHIGYVSSALQWQYKVTVNVRNAIISGFYDSIGIYRKYSDQQKELAEGWLALLGMSDQAERPFNQLSFGDQRLILIARAMVKHPPLLILDEPCLGLDDLNRQLVLSLIEKICAGSESTVLYVNHRPQDNIRGIENLLQMSDYGRV